MSGYNYEADDIHVWLLFDKHNIVRGVYAHKSDAEKDADFLPGHRAQLWAIDFHTVAVDA